MQQALGFRVKSGWATAVVLAGPLDAPRVLHRGIVELSDPDLPESRQPYHAATGVLEEDVREIDRRTRAVRRAAAHSIEALLSEHAAEKAGLVVGSQIDPARIANPHIRAHALEGRLFRTVLEEALRGHGVACTVILEKGALALAARSLGRPEEQLEREVSRLGRSLGGPWRAEEKLAALAAWTQLA